VVVFHATNPMQHGHNMENHGNAEAPKV